MVPRENYHKDVLQNNPIYFAVAYFELAEWYKYKQKGFQLAE